MTLQAALFDLDGTLVDSLDDLTGAVNHALAHFQRPPMTLAEVRQLVGNGSRNLIQRALATDDPALVEQGLRLFLDYNAAHIADKSRLYPGIRSALESLSDQGIPLAVVSNKNESLSRLVLEALSIDRFFGIICGGDTFPDRKPSPLPLLRVSADLGAPPDSTVMVGDSINDVQAARRAGMRSIGCTWGYGAPGDLEQADQLAHSSADLRQLLLHMLQAPALP